MRYFSQLIRQTGMHVGITDPTRQEGMGPSIATAEPSSDIAMRDSGKDTEFMEIEETVEVTPEVADEAKLLSSQQPTRTYLQEGMGPSIAITGQSSDIAMRDSGKDTEFMEIEETVKVTPQVTDETNTEVRVRERLLAWEDLPGESAVDTPMKTMEQVTQKQDTSEQASGDGAITDVMQEESIKINRSPSDIRMQPEILDRHHTMQKTYSQVVRDWVAKKPITETHKNALRNIKPPQSKSVPPLHEEMAAENFSTITNDETRSAVPKVNDEQFVLSIGTIHVTIEEPQKKQGPFHISQPKPEVTDRLAPQFSRLKRHYIRM